MLSKIRSFFSNAKKSGIALALTFAVGLASTVSPVAHASTESEAAMATISTEATALIAAAWPILVTIVVAVIGMKLFKKFASKAS